MGFNGAGKRPHQSFPLARVRISQLQGEIGGMDAARREGLAYDVASR